MAECGDCKHWLCTDYHWGHRGQCRRHAPVGGGWHETSSSDSCGDYEEEQPHVVAYREIEQERQRNNSHTGDVLERDKCPKRWWGLHHKWVKSTVADLPSHLRCIYCGMAAPKYK